MAIADGAADYGTSGVAGVVRVKRNTYQEAGMIVWSSGRGPRLVGCGTALLVSVVIMVLVYWLSGGQCTLVVFP
jgi:hypothetical protein